MGQVVDNFSAIKQLVADLELDVVKNGERGNNAAGVRVRKGLRHLKKLTTDLVRLTIKLDKESNAAASGDASE